MRKIKLNQDQLTSLDIVAGTTEMDARKMANIKDEFERASKIVRDVPGTEPFRHEYLNIYERIRDLEDDLLELNERIDHFAINEVDTDER